MGILNIEMTYDPFMKAKRQRGLGNYNGTRDDWLCAYRAARNRKRMGHNIDVSKDGVEWKAQLVIYYERNRSNSFNFSTVERYRMIKTMDEILAY